MNTTKYIFGKHEYIEGIGNIYPIKLKDYDDFVENSIFLYYSKKHFDSEYQNLPLLQLLLFGLQKEIVEPLVEAMQNTFSLVLNKKVSFFVNDQNSYGFTSEDGSSLINVDNYEELRQTVMHQNLM